TAPQWLTLFLQADHSPGLSIANYLNMQKITLALEPGRSLVDQAAISLFRVTRTKKLADNKIVIFVEGSSFSACETWFSSEYLVDPILISTSELPHTPTQAYIAGHSCLDDDVITHRLINFATTPQAGDLLVYVNTAGYQMDLLENEFHRHPLPRRLMATCCTEGNYAFAPDY
ncbi:decarboxylase, partial [Pseudomonas sp. MWU12-2312b]